MRLIINESDLGKFKKRASRGYPREVYGVLLGKKLSNRTFKILSITIPPVVEATYDYVIPDYGEIDRIVSSSGLTYIGSIHSHPQAPPTVSTHDYMYWDKDRDAVVGILSVRKRNAYKVTELKFWLKNTSLPVKFKTFRPANGHNHNGHNGGPNGHGLHSSARLGPNGHNGNGNGHGSSGRSHAAPRNGHARPRRGR